MNKGFVTIVGIIVVLFLIGLFIKQLLFTSDNINQETIKAHRSTFKNKQIGIQFDYPEEWEIGDSKISIIYWTAVPTYKSEGSIVLKVIPWNQPPDFPSYTEENYKKEILSTSIYYKTLNFISFQNHVKVDGLPAIFTYYKADGVVKKKFYYEVVSQWWNEGLLFTLQGQFAEPELTKSDLDQFIDLIKSIKLDKKTNKNLSI
jgi:hypothetical protein